MVSDSPAAGNAASSIPDAARDAAHEAIACNIGEPGWTQMLGKSPHDLVDIALGAAAPLIAAAERERWTCIEPDPDQPGYNRGVFDLSGFAAAVVTDERDRIWRQPVSQRFELDDCLLHCAGCWAELRENVMRHLPGCSEMRLVDLLGEDGDGDG